MSGRRAAACLLLTGLAAGAFWLGAATTEYNLVLERERPTAVYDFFSYYRPNAEYAFGRLRQGDLPLWNPHQGIGGPFLATLQTGVLYPPNVLHLFLPAQGAFAALAFVHVALAAVLAGALARHLGAGPIGAVTAALLYALSHQLWSSVWTPNTLHAAAWAPGVLLAVQRAVERPGARRAAALAGALGLQLLVGWPYAVAMTALAALVTGGATAVGVAFTRQRLPLAALATLALGATGGACLAAPLLLPSVELMQRSTRAPGTLDEHTVAMRGRLHDPAQFAHSLVHEAGGGAVPGLVSPLLALGAVALAGPRRGQAAALLGAGLLALAVSFPEHTPLHGWLRRLPLLGDFRFPFRYRLITTLALAVCAGVGVSRFEQRGTRVGTRVAAVAAALAVGALALPMSRLFGEPIARFPRRQPSPASALLSPFAGASDFAAQRALVAAPENAGWRSYWRAFGVDKLGQRDGILALQDLEPLSLATTSRIMTFLSKGDAGTDPERGSRVRPTLRAPYSGSAPVPRNPARAVLFDLLSVRFLVMAKPPPWVAARWQRMEEIAEPPFVFRNPNAVPRAWRATRAEREPADPQRALERLVDPGFDARRSVLLDSLPPETSFERGGAESDAETRIELDGAEEVVIRTRGDGPAILVLNDAWYPGWRAKLDGRSVPILRANTAFRAVAVPAGEHTVAMRYVPDSFRAGVGVAAVAAAALLAAVVGPAARGGTRGRARTRGQPRRGSGPSRGWAAADWPPR